MQRPCSLGANSWRVASCGGRMGLSPQEQATWHPGLPLASGSGSIFLAALDPFSYPRPGKPAVTQIAFKDRAQVAFPVEASRSSVERLVPSCSGLSSPGAHTQSLERPWRWGCPQPGFPKSVNPRCLETYFLLGLEDVVPGRRRPLGRPGDFSVPATWSPAGDPTSQEESEDRLGHLGPATCIRGRRVGSFCFRFDF